MGEAIETEDIPDFFKRYGWDYERRGADLFRTGFQGDEHDYEIWLRISEPWVFFTINPFMNKPLEGEHSLEVVSLLLKVNEEINLAKFAIDGDGDLALSVELPSAGTGYTHFADALAALSHYADHYLPEFRAAARQAREGT